MYMLEDAWQTRWVLPSVIPLSCGRNLSRWNSITNKRVMARAIGCPGITSVHQLSWVRSALFKYCDVPIVHVATGLSDGRYYSIQCSNIEVWIAKDGACAQRK